MPEFKPKRVIRPGDEVDHVLQQQLYKYTKHYVENLYFGPDPNEDKSQTVFKGARIIKLDNKYAPQILKGSQLKIYPYTIVNLLGKYGDFETDSNGDGLADGWSGTLGASLDTGIIGAKCQKKSYKADTNGDFGLLTRSISLQLNHYYFISMYAKATTDHPDPENVSTLWRRLFWIGRQGSTWLQTYGFTVPPDNAWHRIFNKVIYTNSDIDNFIIEGFYVNHPHLDDGYTYTVWIDGVTVYDLTAMGALPPTMQEYYGVTNWADLDEDTIIRDGLLPYCSSVCTLGWTWAGDL